jgi:adenylyl- and sulfurtransferase ThiI
MVDKSTTLLHITLSGDVYLKSRRTQKGLIRRVLGNLGLALSAAGYEGAISRVGSHRYAVSPPSDNVDAVRRAALSVFGVAAVGTLIEVPFESTDGLARRICDLSSETVGDLPRQSVH